MKFTIRKPNYQLVISVAAIFLSLCGLLVSVYQARIARENQQMSVWPHLQIDIGHTNQDFDFFVSNNGVGPALIRQTELRYAGKLMSDHITFYRSLVRNQLSDSLRLQELRYQTLEMGDVLKAGEDRSLFMSKQNGSLADTLEKITMMDSAFRYCVTYSDVYNACWQVVYSGGRSTVTKLTDCP
jgi:hypothetical protein